MRFIKNSYCLKGWPRNNNRDIIINRALCISLYTISSDAHQKWKILQIFSASDMIETTSKLTFWSLNGLHRTNGWGVMGTYFMHFNMGRLDTEIAKTGYNRSEWWNSSFKFQKKFCQNLSPPKFVYMLFRSQNA